MDSRVKIMLLRSTVAHYFGVRGGIEVCHGRAERIANY
jgi:hypothetical protein